MHLVVLQFLAGFFGALTSMFLLGSLGSDYWLLVSESCAKDDATVFRLWRVTEVSVGHICSHILSKFTPTELATLVVLEKTS